MLAKLSQNEGHINPSPRSVSPRRDGCDQIDGGRAIFRSPTGVLMDVKLRVRSIEDILGETAAEVAKEKDEMERREADVLQRIADVEQRLEEVEKGRASMDQATTDLSSRCKNLDERSASFAKDVDTQMVTLQSLQEERRFRSVNGCEEAHRIEELFIHLGKTVETTVKVLEDCKMCRLDLYINTSLEVNELTDMGAAIDPTSTYEAEAEAAIEQKSTSETLMLGNAEKPLTLAHEEAPQSKVTREATSPIYPGDMRAESLRILSAKVEALHEFVSLAAWAASPGTSPTTTAGSEPVRNIPANPEDGLLEATAASEDASPRSGRGLRFGVQFVRPVKVESPSAATIDACPTPLRSWHNIAPARRPVIGLRDNPTYGNETWKTRESHSCADERSVRGIGAHRGLRSQILSELRSQPCHQFPDVRIPDIVDATNTIS